MTKSEIQKFYNIDKIVLAKELATLSRTYKDNPDTIIVMMKRKEVHPKVPQYFTEFVNKQEKFNKWVVKQFRVVPQYFAEFVKQNNKILQEILNRLTKIEDTLSKHDKLFKQHGWI